MIKSRGDISPLRFVLTLLSCSLILIPPGGLVFGFSAISPYLLSYLHASGDHHHGTTKADLGLIYAALLLGQGVSMIIGGLAERKWGTRTLAIFAVSLFNLSLILFRWSLGSVILLSLNYLLAGFSLGFTKVICLVVGLSWVEKNNHGLASGLIFAAFGLSSALISPLQTLFINPLNQAPEFNPSVGEFLFTDPEILSAVPQMFTIFAVASAFLQFPLATMLVKRPIVESYGGKRGVQEMLKRYEFYVMFAIFALNKMPIAYVSSYAKIYGETFLDADMFLSLVLGVAGVFNSLGRPFWGFVQDKLGVRWSLALIAFFTSLSIILSFLCGFSEHDASIPYTLTTWASFFCVSGNYAVFPAATARYFGDHALGLKYGVLYVSQGVGAVISALYMGLIPFWTPLVICIVATSLVSCLLAILLRDGGKSEVLEHEEAAGLLSEQGRRISEHLSSF